MKKIGIWGWWQGGNLGDNWIKKTLSSVFPEADFIDTRTTDFSDYSFVICGGGGLFIKDVISPWNGYSQDIPFGMFGIGAEFPHKTNEAIKLWEKSRFFYARDYYSLQCMKLEALERSYDVTFISPLVQVDDEKLNLDNLLLVWRDGKTLLSDQLFFDYIRYDDTYGQFLEIAKDEFVNINFNDFQTENDNIESIIGDAGFIISGRFHGIVAAIQKRIPCIAIDICPKIRELMKDCGLEEYCIKISEIHKLKHLIKKAKDECNVIRNKQQLYTERANIELLKNIENIKSEIDKVINPLKVLHYGSYWMKDNDVVKTMCDDLSRIADTIEIDLKAYENICDTRIKTKIRTSNGHLCILDAQKIISDFEKYNPDVVVFNSGGLVPEDDVFRYMKNNGIVSVGISLSDPDVYPYNGAVYAYKFDLFYTNSKYSFEQEYKNNNIHLLPFGASVLHHYDIRDRIQVYDVVIVAHFRKDREEIVKKLQEKFTIGVYGSGWKHSLGVVNGLAHVEAINKGKMYLSFSRTNAGFDNIKVGLFEAIACNQVVITKYMEELSDYFVIGEEILCYKDDEEIPQIVDYYLKHPDELEKIRINSYKRFLREHTYTNRWKAVKNDILNYRNEYLKKQ